MAEPIEMPFGLWTRVLLDGVQMPSMGRDNFEGWKRRPIVNYRHLEKERKGRVFV